MTYDEWEQQRYIDEITMKYHRRTGKYPTKNEAIRAIRSAKHSYLIRPRKNWGRHAFEYRCRVRFACDELIRRIQISDEPDPIKIIYIFKDFMDDMVTLSDNRITWIFAAQMRDAAGEILEMI